MQLWTDYEGLTIDGAFPLKQLLLPEGRSAFFSTANGKGEPVVLRLIECHFDEEEILARWRCLEALNHPALLRLERYGQIELDGNPAVYAVFEKVDANLAEPLARGRLSVKDTAQIAASLVAALDMLHTHGFVHEHVEARNVFAIGDAVKLRSDCIREAREGAEGREAKQRDVHGLAVVLLQALTQRQTLDGVRDADLPAPFHEIVRNGLSGAWGLAEIATALQPLQTEPAKPKRAPAPKPAPAKPAAELPLFPAPAENASPARPAPPKAEEDDDGWQPNAVRSSIRQQVAGRYQEGRSALRSRWINLAALVVMLVLAGGWMLHHIWYRSTHSAHAPAVPVKSARHTPAPQPVSHPARPAVARLIQGNTAAKGAHNQWRVIAYTYRRQADAQNKAASMAQKHPGLNPQVFSPSGHAPYLVAIGGVMNRDDAYALARRARKDGLPRDTYAQNY